MSPPEVPQGSLRNFPLVTEGTVFCQGEEIASDKLRKLLRAGNTVRGDFPSLRRRQRRRRETELLAWANPAVLWMSSVIVLTSTFMFIYFYLFGVSFFCLMSPLKKKLRNTVFSIFTLFSADSLIHYISGDYF
jgi:hypothetical protein